MSSLKNVFLTIALAGCLMVSWAQQVTELTIGDTLPDIVISNVYNADQALSTADLFSDGPLIISFWATWCSPCIKEMGLLDSLMGVHEELRVLAVTYQDKAVIDAFMANNPGAQPDNVVISTNDTLFSKYFKHQALPHNVWIDGSGTIVATTAFDEVREETIAEFMAGKIPDVAIKKDIAFDYTRPLQVEDSLIHFRSIFQPHIEGVSIGGVTANYNGLGKPNMDRFFGFNVDRLTLAWAAYTREYLANVNYYLLELRTSDSVKYFWPEAKPELFAKSGYKNRQEWKEENIFFYELRFPEKVDDDLFYSFMVKDIEYNLGIKGYFEARERMCRVVRIGADKAAQFIAGNDDTAEPFFEESTDGMLVLRNVPLKFFLNWITQLTIGWRDHRSQNEPFVNETGVERISLEIDTKRMHRDNVHDWEDYLGTLGFVFSTEKRMHPVLVLTD